MTVRFWVLLSVALSWGTSVYVSMTISVSLSTLSLGFSVVGLIEALW